MQLHIAKLIFFQSKWFGGAIGISGQYSNSCIQIVEMFCNGSGNWREFNFTERESKKWKDAAVLIQRSAAPQTITLCVYKQRLCIDLL